MEINPWAEQVGEYEESYSDKQIRSAPVILALAFGSNPGGVVILLSSNLVLSISH